MSCLRSGDEEHKDDEGDGDEEEEAHAQGSFLGRLPAAGCLADGGGLQLLLLGLLLLLLLGDLPWGFGEARGGGGGGAEEEGVGLR